MTEHSRIAALKLSAAALPSNAEIWKSVRAICRKRGDDMFVVPLRLEDLSSQDRAVVKTEGTVFEPLEQALADAGIPTDGTLGGLMQPPFSFTETQAHVFCGCNISGEKVSGFALELIYHGMSLPRL